MSIQSTRPANAARLVATAAALLPLTLAACVQVEGPPDRSPRNLQAQVSPDAQVANILLSVERFLGDTNRNGYPDTINASVFLFPTQDQPPVPIHAEGSLVFELSTATTPPRRIARWTLNPAELNAARARVSVGPVYVIELDINAVTSDRIPRQNATLTASFIASQAAPEVTSSPITIFIGGNDNNQTQAPAPSQ